jgi:hypothetical protein
VTLVLVLVFRSRSDGREPSSPASRRPVAVLDASFMTPDPPSSQDAAPGMTTPTRMATLIITVKPYVENTVFTFREKRYQIGIFRIMIPASSVPEVITIEAPGFRDESILVTPNQDVAMTVNLQSKNEPPRWVPMGGMRPTDHLKDLPE